MHVLDYSRDEIFNLKSVVAKELYDVNFDD